MIINSTQVKEKVYSLGCHLCGIASIDRFTDMPQLTNPLSILKDAKSVIVIAIRFLQSVILSSSTIPYTIIRNSISTRIDEITISLSYYFEELGYISIPTGAISPVNFDASISKRVGLISLKNAAYQAGLGVIGKNTLLITPQFGNMVWLGAVITSIELDPDPIINHNPCNTHCRICIDNCPVNAIDGSKFMDRQKCWNYAFGEENGGSWRIKCFNCRTKCPYSKGFKL